MLLKNNFGEFLSSLLSLLILSGLVPLSLFLTEYFRWKKS